MRSQGLDVLIDNGICEPADDDGLALTREFRRAVERHKNSLTVESARESFGERMGAEWETRLGDVIEEDLRFVAEIAALDERKDLPAQQMIHVSHVLGQFSDPPADGGVPSEFLPIKFDRLRFLLPFHPRAIVYVWQSDCDPCDVVRENFEDLFGEPSEEIGLFAINGPAYAKELDEKFDVYGAPTVLFSVSGDVDMRLLGSRSRDFLEREIDQFVELASP